ncbi:MAG TPA: SGNH/GDSL hydrolase family protein [Bryobacteraceae bacterium]|jgi:lysophospholipase L1-like esterase|nr:SGNH/GDSL hydrolase family protein [Bryobacteraceae bacterium]
MRRILAILLFVSAARAQGDFYLKDGDRVVFYGDSITDQRLYTTFTESYVVTRFPKMKVTFVHSGWGGDRVSGGGGGPVELRLERDVFAYNPTVLTIMLGMNDGSYRAFNPDIFERYSAGYESIIRTVKQKLPEVRITAIQPSPYDDVTRPPAFAGGYNAVLVRYGKFLAELASRENLALADLNTPVVAALKKAKTLDRELALKLLPDRVHPGAGGHLLMAGALLRAWQAPALVSSAEIDADSKKVTAANTEVSVLYTADALTWTQEDAALPMPLDPKDPALALALKASDFNRTLNRQTLAVKGLTRARYVLRIDGEFAGSFSRQDLAEGVDLGAMPTPMAKQALEVHALTLKRAAIHNARWRQVQVPMQDTKAGRLQAALDSLDALEAELVEQQRAAAQPKPRRYELTPE